MKCFRRSIRSFASSGFCLLLATAALHGAGSPSPAANPSIGLGTGAVSTDVVVRAIEKAVHARVGRDITVSVSEVSGVRLSMDSAVLVAVPDPSARIGAAVRFVLSDGTPGRGRSRVGEATATIQVSAFAVRAQRPIARGALVEIDDVATKESDLSGRPLRPLLALEDAVGARATRDLAEDSLVTTADIVPEPLVKAGDTVRAHVHVGDVELIGDVVAAESGLKDEVIRVVNQESRHTLRARVIGSGEVEVVNVR